MPGENAAAFDWGSRRPRPFAQAVLWTVVVGIWLVGRLLHGLARLRYCLTVSFYGVAERGAAGLRASDALAAVNSGPGARGCVPGSH